MIEIGGVYQTLGGEVRIEGKNNEGLYEYMKGGVVRTTTEKSLIARLKKYYERFSVNKEIEFKRDFKFGVEMEILIPRNVDLVEELEAVGVRLIDDLNGGNMTHTVMNGGEWKMVYDGSISNDDGMRGVELVSPPSFNFNELKKVCDVLKEIGAKVNYSCGLHVHHDINDLKRQQIIRVYNFYDKYVKGINAIMEEQRMCSEYCRPVEDIIDKVNESYTMIKLLKDVAGKGRGGYYNRSRYYTINLRSYLYYGTIEFRQHQGSIDFEEISNWIILTHKIIERGLEIGKNVVRDLNKNESKVSTICKMMKELKCDNTELQKYMVTKAKNRRVA